MCSRYKIEFDNWESALSWIRKFPTDWEPTVPGNGYHRRWLILPGWQRRGLHDYMDQRIQRADEVCITAWGEIQGTPPTAALCMCEYHTIQLENGEPHLLYPIKNRLDCRSSIFLSEFYWRASQHLRSRSWHQVWLEITSRCCYRPPRCFITNELITKHNIDLLQAKINKSATFMTSTVPLQSNAIADQMYVLGLITRIDPRMPFFGLMMTNGCKHVARTLPEKSTSMVVDV